MIRTEPHRYGRGAGDDTSPSSVPCSREMMMMKPCLCIPLLRSGLLRPGLGRRAAPAQHQRGRRGVPRLLSFIIFNKFPFHLFIFCTYLVNISGMLFERNVGQYRPENRCRCCGGGGSRAVPCASGVLGAHSSWPGLKNQQPTRARRQLRWRQSLGKSCSCVITASMCPPDVSGARTRARGGSSPERSKV